MAKIYKLVKGTRIPDEIVRICEAEGIRTARVEAIGGVEELKIAYFNHREKKYEEREYNEFLEVTGILGNVTLKDGRQFLHIHGTFGRRDCSVVGGHVVSATVAPMLELVITPTENIAERRFDDETGLSVIYRFDEKA